MRYILSSLIIGLFKLIIPITQFEQIKYKNLATIKTRKLSLASVFHNYYLNKRNIYNINLLFENDLNFNIPTIFKKRLISIVKNLNFNLASVYPSDIILLWYLIKKYKVDNFIETGTGYGYSTIFIYEGLKTFNKKKITFHSYGLPTDQQKKHTAKLFKKYPEIKSIIGKVPEIFSKKQNIKRKNLGIFIDGPKGSSKDFEKTLTYIFNNFDPKFVAIHDCEYHLPALKKNNNNTRINYTRSKLVHFYCKNLKKSKYKLSFYTNKNFQYFQNLDNLVLRTTPKIQPYHFKNAHNLSYSPCTGVIYQK